MDRTTEQRDETLIDLGAASVETKGPFAPGPDDAHGQLIGGITDE